jgi:exodeoxyribonuclease-5
LQRDAGVPASSPERARQRAEGILDALCHSAPEVCVSWPRAERDEVFDASPLIAAHAEMQAAAVAAFPGPARNRQLFDARPLPIWLNDSAPPVAARERVPGGTRLIALQAGCPARAYFEMRLGAAELVNPAPGSNARVRGTIVHDALRGIFVRIRSGRELAAMPEDELDRLMAAEVERAVAAAIPARPG